MFKNSEQNYNISIINGSSDNMAELKYFGTI
jgi:hypothetical protein